MNLIKEQTLKRVAKKIQDQFSPETPWIGKPLKVDEFELRGEIISYLMRCGEDLQLSQSLSLPVMRFCREKHAGKHQINVIDVFEIEGYYYIFVSDLSEQELSKKGRYVYEIWCRKKNFKDELDNIKSESDCGEIYN